MMGGVNLIRLLALRHFPHQQRNILKLSSNFSTDNSFEPFHELVRRRRHEARRSILVEVNDRKSASDLQHIISEYGTVKNMFHYETGKRDMILVEYEDSLSVGKALRNSSYPPPSNSSVQVHSPFLLLDAKETSGNSGNSSKLPDSAFCVPLISDEAQLSEKELHAQLYHCSDVSEQMQMVYNHQKLTELGYRLRFFTSRQIEIALSGMFPSAAVFPFGSSVNTFGRRNCDLDMALYLTEEGTYEDCHRLVFQPKKIRAMANSEISVHHLALIADVIDTFLPGCSQVRRILRARVPIIKYYQDYTGIECDFCINQRSGFYMGEILYLYGCIDPRVRPLVFTVRLWAKNRQLTSKIPGRWITNFSLTLLVMFYLMKTSPHILPSLQMLINLARSSDKRGTKDIDYALLRNIKLPTPSENKDSLVTLLKGFFEFYDKFDFKQKGLSIISGNDFVKPVHKPIYIQNPIVHDLNVSANVSTEERERLNREITHARYALETHETKTEEGGLWGILPFLCLEDPGPVSVKGGAFNIDWNELFSTTSTTESDTTNPANQPGKKTVEKQDTKSAKNVLNAKNNKKKSTHTCLDEEVRKLSGKIRKIRKQKGKLK